MSQGLETLTSLGRAVFSEQSYFDEIWCRRSLPMELSPNYFRRFPARPRRPRFHLVPSQRSSLQAISHSFLSVHALPPIGALPKLFPTVSIPFMMSPLRLVSPNRALPKLFPTVSFPCMMSSLQSRSLPTERSPQAISHCFLTVHGVVASVSLPPNRALPKLFLTDSFPVYDVVASVSLPPTELSPSYFPRFPFRSWYRCFRLAPCQRSSPQAISHGFLSVHDSLSSLPSRSTRGEVN